MTAADPAGATRRKPPLVAPAALQRDGPVQELRRPRYFAERAGGLAVLYLRQSDASAGRCETYAAFTSILWFEKEGGVLLGARRATRARHTVERTVKCIAPRLAFW